MLRVLVLSAVLCAACSPAPPRADASIDPAVMASAAPPVAACVQRVKTFAACARVVDADESATGDPWVRCDTPEGGSARLYCRGARVDVVTE